MNSSPPPVPPPLPPQLLGSAKAPPVLPPFPSPGMDRPVKVKKRYSPFRRVLRVTVWLLLLGVVGYRIFIFRPDPSFRFNPGGGQGGPWNGREWREPAPRRQVRSALPTNLWRIELKIDSDGVAKLRRHRGGFRGRGGMDTDGRPEVEATVIEGGRTYTNVAVHLKGAAGSFRPFDDQPAFTLNFNKHAKGQKFHGHTKISLNNSVQDQSFMNEKLSRELFVQAGVPVPRAEHATVVVNGRELGLYVVTQGWGKPFLREHFPNVDGNLYDGGFVQDIDGGLSVVSGENEESHPGLERLIDAMQSTGRSNRWARLSATLDVDRFASLLAMDTLLCNWDGYGMNRNNYRIFHDLSQDKMVMMPHGLDQLLGYGRRMNVDSTIDPGWRGRLAAVFMATPEGRKKYYERLATIRTNVFDPDRVGKRIEEIAATIRPTIAAYDANWAQHHDRLTQDLIGRVRRRAESVSEQLARPRDALNFGRDGFARVQNWRTSQTGEGARVRFERMEGDSPALSIRFPNGASAASWRSDVRLSPGLYTFEGRVRLAAPGEGLAAFRVSGMQTDAVELSGTDWVPMSFEFECDGLVTEIQLVAEAAGAPGTEVQFDLGAMRVLRREKGEKEP